MNSQISSNPVSEEYQRLPQVEKVLQLSFLAPFIEAVSRPVVTDLIRETLSQIRQSDEFRAQGHRCTKEQVNQQILTRCQALTKQRQQRVINATGIAVHTNLGRSPIHPKVWDKVTEVNTGYCNLELDLATGKRGMRNGLIPSLVKNWIGAEHTVVVNNNAASVHLMLMALAQGKEVIISRGELVQIGGGFRIPDIIAMAGCKLVEVGTTNITTADDYINAITEDTAAVLIVHQSNFSIEGFTSAPDVQELAEKLPEQVKLLVDQGSGLSDETYAQNEKSIRQYLHSGADIVCFSGDKILGGPQAGLVVGNPSLLDKLAKHPMMRAFRPGRITLSLLEELLVEKLNRSTTGKGVAERVIQALKEVNDWSQELVTQWSAFATLIPVDSQVGGGSIPYERYPNQGIALSLPGSAQKHLDALRNMSTPIIGYLRQDKLVLNLSTVLEQDKSVLVEQITRYLAKFT